MLTTAFWTAFMRRPPQPLQIQIAGDTRGQLGLSAARSSPTDNLMSPTSEQLRLLHLQQKRRDGVTQRLERRADRSKFPPRPPTSPASSSKAGRITRRSLLAGPIACRSPRSFAPRVPLPSSSRLAALADKQPAAVPAADQPEVAHAPPVTPTEAEACSDRASPVDHSSLADARSSPALRVSPADRSSPAPLSPPEDRTPLPSSEPSPLAAPVD